MVIIVLLQKQRRHSVLQSDYNYAFIALNRTKHKANTFITPESLTFCQTLVGTRPEKPGPTCNSGIYCIILEHPEDVGKQMFPLFFETKAAFTHLG